MSRPPVFIADFLQALVELRIGSPDAARDVMRMLSLDSWADIALAAPSPGQEPPDQPDSIPPPPGSTTGPGPHGEPARSGHAPSEAASAEPVRALARKVPAPSGATTPAWSKTPPLWVKDVGALKRATPYKTPPPDALFDPRQKRAIVGSLAAARIEDDALDTDALIAVLARGEPVVALPRRRAWGVRRGLQVLVDRGAGMAPFTADIEQLLSQLLELVPRDRVQPSRFVGSPLRGVKVPRKPQASWRPPERDTALLVISDLGLCNSDESFGSAGNAEWLEFASAARRAGLQLRTLVPYAPARWPAALSGPLCCVHWDRRTTAGSVRRALSGVGL